MERPLCIVQRRHKPPRTGRSSREEHCAGLLRLNYPRVTVALQFGELLRYQNQRPVFWRYSACNMAAMASSSNNSGKQSNGQPVAWARSAARSAARRSGRWRYGSPKVRSARESIADFKNSSPGTRWATGSRRGAHARRRNAGFAVTRRQLDRKRARMVSSSRRCG